jgi:hypothetical protein
MSARRPQRPSQLEGVQVVDRPGQRRRSLATPLRSVASAMDGLDRAAVPGLSPDCDGGLPKRGRGFDPRIDLAPEEGASSGWRRRRARILCGRYLGGGRAPRWPGFRRRRDGLALIGDAKLDLMGGFFAASDPYPLPLHGPGCPPVGRRPLLDRAPIGRAAPSSGPPVPPPRPAAPRATLRVPFYSEAIWRRP